MGLKENLNNRICEVIRVYFTVNTRVFFGRNKFSKLYESEIYLRKLTRSFLAVKFIKYILRIVLCANINSFIMHEDLSSCYSILELLFY